MEESKEQTTNQQDDGKDPQDEGKDPGRSEREE